jgi:hypothetical protein
MTMVTDNTAGMAIGIPPIKRTIRFTIPAWYSRHWIGNKRMISVTIPTVIEMIQKFDAPCSPHRPSLST